MCYGECDLGIADDGGRGRRRQFGDVPASSHPLRDGSMTMEGVGNTEPCSRTLVLPSHYMKLHGVLPGTRPGINNALSINKAVVVFGRWDRERRPKEARGSPARTATGMRRVD